MLHTILSKTIHNPLITGWKCIKNKDGYIQLYINTANWRHGRDVCQGLGGPEGTSRPNGSVKSLQGEYCLSEVQ
jgi:hypothetical protein